MVRPRQTSVEYLGHESLLYYELAEAEDQRVQQSVIERVEGQLPVMDSVEQWVYIDLPSIYVFDQNGMAVARIKGVGKK